MTEPWSRSTTRMAPKPSDLRTLWPPIRQRKKVRICPVFLDHKSNDFMLEIVGFFCLWDDLIWFWPQFWPQCQRFYLVNRRGKSIELNTWHTAARFWKWYVPDFRDIATPPGVVLLLCTGRRLSVICFYGSVQNAAARSAIRPDTGPAGRLPLFCAWVRWYGRSRS